MPTLEQQKDRAFTLETALAQRDQGTFEQWVDDYLRGPGNNVALADGLLRERRWWYGPEEVLLSDLTYKCGPGLEFHEETDAWNDRIQTLARKIQDGLKVPPLIAEFKDWQLLLADGNHRCGALQLTGTTKYWTAVWFNSESDWVNFTRSR